MHYSYFLLSTGSNSFIIHNYEVLHHHHPHLHIKKLSHKLIKKVSQDYSAGRIWSWDWNAPKPAEEPEFLPLWYNILK